MKITLSPHPAPRDIKFIQNKLKTYNEKFTELDQHQELAVFLKDEKGKIQGGIIGGTYWNWLHIDALWIEESLQHKGYGKKLLDAAEKEAKKRGCHHAHLDTHDFQAVHFYQKNGYTTCGQLDDLPKGYNRYLLKKTL